MRKSYLQLGAENIIDLPEKIAKLSDREQEVVRCRFGVNREKLTLKAIGQKIGVTKERVRQIEAKAIRKMIGPARWSDICRRIRDERRGRSNAART